MCPTDNLTDGVKRRYNRTALFYDAMERLIPAAWRQRALTLAGGRVLEVGVGTGGNFPYYPPDCEVTAIDFSPGMLARARAKLPSARVPVTLREMDVEHLEFAAGTFDTVVATCVFCSVPHPVAGLREVRRVCKAGGKIILLEHVRSDNPLLGAVMDLLNPAAQLVIGDNINRRTVANVIRAGLRLERVDNVLDGLVKLIVATP